MYVASRDAISAWLPRFTPIWASWAMFEGIVVLILNFHPAKQGNFFPPDSDLAPGTLSLKLTLVVVD